MSFYSDESIQTEIIDPEFFQSKDRCEFRLDRGTLLPNLYLSGVGPIGVPNNALFINSACGVIATIKNIHLLDGSVVLQSSYNVNERMCFENKLKNNSVNSDVDRFLKKHGLGYKYVTVLSDNNYFPLSANQDSVQGLAGGNVFSTGIGGRMNQNDAEASGDTRRGLIDLRELLPFLANIVCLPTQNIFKQLRLIIEYETNVNNLFHETNLDYRNRQPQLIIDKVVNPNAEASLIGRLGSFNFMNYERTQFDMEAITAGRQEKEVKVATYNNKFLNKILLIKQYQTAGEMKITANLTNGRGLMGGSIGLGADESFNVRVNGVNILPRGKVEGVMRKQAMVVDTYGAQNQVWNELFPVYDGAGTGTGRKEGDCVVTNQTTNLGNYSGCRIGQKIEELVVTVGRTFLGGNGMSGNQQNTDNSFGPQKDGIRCVLIGEVVKEISFGAGGYVVGYA